MNIKFLKLQLAVCALLSLILLAEWVVGISNQRSLQQSLRYAQDEQQTGLELPVIDTAPLAATSYSELVERPLFIEGRRPLPEAPTENNQTVELGQIDDWELIGIYNKGKQPIALFSKKNEAKKYLKVGNDQMVSGWALKEILPDRVTLQQAGQQKMLLLRKPRSEEPPPEIAPVAAQPPPQPPRQPRRPPNAEPPTNPENVKDDS